MIEIFDYERWKLHLDSNYVSKEIHLVFYCLFSPCILCTITLQRLEYFIMGDFQKAICSLRPINCTDFCSIISIKGNNWNTFLFFKPSLKIVAQLLGAGKLHHTLRSSHTEKVVKSSVSAKFYSYSWNQGNLIFAITRGGAICCTEDEPCLYRLGSGTQVSQAAAQGSRGESFGQVRISSKMKSVHVFNNTKLELDWASLLANNPAYILQRT